jgi:hypothetical protein
MDKKLNGSTYIELCYISPDWRIWRNKKLQNILADMVADVLEVPHDKRAEAFYWVEDVPSKHKHLLVHIHFVPERNRTYKHFRFVCDYAMGLANGMGFC